MGDAEEDDGIPLVFGVELGAAAELQQLLGLLQGCLHADAHTDQSAPGGVPLPGEHLVQVHLAHACPLGQHGLGYPLFQEKLVQDLKGLDLRKVFLVLRQKLPQVRSLHQALLQIAGFFHCSSRLYILCKIVYNYLTCVCQRNQYAGCIPWGDFYLPISFVKKINKEQEKVQKKYSLEEAKTIGIKELQEELDKEIENKENIVNKNINTYEQEDGVDIYVTYEVLENIGTNEKIVF